MINIVRRDPEHLQDFLKELYLEVTKISPHFAGELLNSLYDEETVLVSVRKWMRKVQEPVQTIIQKQQLKETAEQTVLINSITSLIKFYQFDWRKVFEDVCIVDEILQKDPTKTYPQMDFATRDMYRHAVEKYALASKNSEIVIASNALTLAQKGKDFLHKHVGYYLIDQGRLELDKLSGAKLPVVEGLKRWIFKFPALFYIGCVGLLMAVAWGCLLYVIRDEFVNWKLFSLIAFLSLFPVSEICVQILNLLISQFIPPRSLPKLSFKEGIPEQYKTIGIVPTMLSTPESIRHDVEELQIRYLASRDPNMKFGLVTDFLDAPKETMPDDQMLLNLVVNEIKKLNEQYGEGSFFLFHRARTWNARENVWMGWERKRGKLELLNRYLSGERNEATEHFLLVGNAADLQGIVFVITLDADTQLPKDQAIHLVETITHPLNVPYLSSDGRRVERGYTIIQPIVMPSLPSSNATYFSSIFTDTIGTNPYAQTISDVYQDLAGEGTYYGKGIYNLAIFNKVLTGRFPNDHVLSHDLLEGGYVRTALANDIELTDSFPPNYRTFSIRLHRWLRGDWQISDWIFPYVPLGNDKSERNPLLLLDRWKIFDNLRRAVYPIAIIALLLIGWYYFPTNHFWAGFIAFSLFIAVLAPFGVNLLIAPIETGRQLKSIGNGFLRCLILIALQPHIAFLSLDALGRFIFRRFISHKRHLEWTPTQLIHSKHKSGNHGFVLKLCGISLFSILVGYLFWHHGPAALITAWPYLLLWLCAPVIVALLNKPYYLPASRDLTTAEREILRGIARRTWRYFDTFVNPTNNWLPPDNFQDYLNVEVARRTSTTNIGFWMMSIISAHDFGYVSEDMIIDKLTKTIDTLKKLEGYEGHFYNWYDTGTLLPLEPKYVSTVDSGNLLACFWTLETALPIIYTRPALTHRLFEGMNDTLQQALENEKVRSPELNKIEEKLKKIYPSVVEQIASLRSLEKDLQNSMAGINITEHYWFEELLKQCQMWVEQINRYFSWVDVLQSVSDKTLIGWEEKGLIWKKEALLQAPSLRAFYEGHLKGVDNFMKVREKSKEAGFPQDYATWLDRLADALSKAQWFAGEIIGKGNQVIQDVRVFSDRMNMRFLYQENRRVFSIGYNAVTHRLDTSAYDLLASEARLTSIVAIAKGDVPVSHWWSLGRPYSTVDGKKALLSWGGTMFEYLMPVIWTKCYNNSLLDQACHAAVDIQIKYGKNRGIPWGISESAFSGLDAHKIYQYRSFGVPGLGLKRGLFNDLVVSPYSTFLALMIKPLDALENSAALKKSTHNSILGDYGFYEAIDFSRQRDQRGERGVIIRTYMAHHQGMSLLAIDNVLFNNTFQNYFHIDPRIQAVESLLYERIPSKPSIVEGFARDRRPLKLTRIPDIPTLGKIDTHESPIPKVNILSNGKLSVMVTNAGGGYLRLGDYDITRWKADVTMDSWGSFCYIKDIDSGKIWSTFFQPTHVRPEKTIIHFSSDKSEFQRIDNEIEITTEIVVSPEDNAEVRRLTISNISRRIRTLELTSYGELSLVSPCHRSGSSDF